MGTTNQSVASINSSLTTLKNYVATIDGEYGAYVNSHNLHNCAADQVQYIDGARPSSGHSWHEYRDKVSEVVTFLELYVDDSAWVDQVGNRSAKWNTAHSHATEAHADLAPNKLPALASWQGPAGDGYRSVAPTMRSATNNAVLGAQVMKGACTAVSDAGETFFSSVATAASTLAGGLRHYQPAPAPRQPGDPPSVAPTGAYTCGQLHDNDDAGSEPWTAMESCTSAKTALETAINGTLNLQGPTADGQPLTVEGSYGGNWPPAPG
jgi:hypothetical protein